MLEPNSWVREEDLIEGQGICTWCCKAFWLGKRQKFCCKKCGMDKRRAPEERQNVFYIKCGRASCHNYFDGRSHIGYFCGERCKPTLQELRRLCREH